MNEKPTYEKLEQRIRDLEKEATERKRVEEALRESEEKFSKAFQRGPMVVAISSLEDGRYLEINSTFESFTGYTREEVVNHTSTELNLWFDSNDRTRATALLKKNGSISNFEARIRCKSGEIRNGLMSAELLKLDARDRILSTIIDITERKQAEEALRESEERLSSFMNSASDSLYLLDSDLNFVEVNKRGLEIIGKKREEVVGKNITDIVPGIKESGRYEKHLEVIKTGIPFEIDDFVPHPIFGDLHFILKSFKVGDGLGVITSDITERKKAEEALRKSEERYRTLFDNIPVGIGVGSSEGRALAANDTLLQMTGYRKAELNQISLQELYQNPEDRELFLKQLMTEGFVHGFETQFRRKDATLFYGSITVTPFYNEDEPSHLMVMMDITDRKQSEEEREKLINELQEALKEIKTLRGILPICASCKKIRDDKGYWNQIESYILKHSDAQFTHGICPECAKKIYPDLDLPD